MPNPDSYDVETLHGVGRLIYAATRIEQVLSGRLRQMLAGSGTTPAQYRALKTLALRDGHTSAQLARDSMVSPQSMWEIVSVLDSRGLVVRKGSRTNRREMTIHLTADGLDFVERFEGDIAELQNELLQGVGADDVDAFCRGLLGAARHLAGNRLPFD